MNNIVTIPLKEIIIQEAFKQTPPGENKLERVELEYLNSGALKGIIILNKNNVLLDGYITYLTALKHGIDKVNVTYGYIELIEATHYQGGKKYYWRVPQRLNGSIHIGDKVIVRTATGVKRVTVGNIITQETSPEGRNKEVIKVVKPYALASTLSGVLI